MTITSYFFLSPFFFSLLSAPVSPSSSSSSCLFPLFCSTFYPFSTPHPTQMHILPLSPCLITHSPSPLRNFLLPRILFSVWGTPFNISYSDTISSSSYPLIVSSPLPFLIPFINHLSPTTLPRARQDRGFGVFL